MNATMMLLLSYDYDINSQLCASLYKEQARSQQTCCCFGMGGSYKVGSH